MKLADYVIDFFAKLNVKHCFVVTGGADLHLLNSVADHPNMQYVCVQHEQFGGAAADGYSRYSQNLGLAITTSGPGATNLLTSICSAYFDSIPIVCITGQVAKFRLRPNTKLRQKGFQETDVCSIFKPITKYTSLIKDPLKIRYELEKAVYLAKEGRQGPVVVDIPDDLQRADIDPKTLESFVPPNKKNKSYLDAISKMLQYIKNSKMPLIIVGGGIHLAKAEEEFLAFASHHKIPIVTTWAAAALLSDKDELNMGRMGICGPRAGNFAVQQADLIIAVGTRLCPMVTGGRQDLFAPRAKKIMIDIDPEELNKFNKDTFTLDLAIQADLKSFFSECKNYFLDINGDLFKDWKTLIRKWKKEYPIIPLDTVNLKDKVNPYVFIKKLSSVINEKDIIFADTGANLCWIMQSFEFKKGQKIFSAWNNTPMGYALPASIGAALASQKQIICLIGDGGLMMCLQELATVHRYNLPIKIFVFDNKGYTTVKQTIDFWLNSRYVAVDQKSGLSFPDYKELAKAFHIPYFYIHDSSNFSLIKEVYEYVGPCFCHLNIDEEQKIDPMLKYGKGLEGLFPEIPEKELKEIMQEHKTILKEKNLVNIYD